MQPRTIKYALSEDEIFELIENGKVGHLATVGEDGWPYVIPINYVTLNGKLYLHCRKAGGMKLDNLRDDDRVCFEVSTVSGYKTGETPCKNTTLFRSAIGRGRARILGDGDPLIEATLLRFTEVYAPHLSEPVIPKDKMELAAVIELTIDKWTGKYSS
ncbi:MAG: pyridoxamine 5'-phosphate oxidase family protein [Deltaproteobacteria bacterium]|jgi:nitroimidazol reductase NimA-like FMN-containing flavoprotein (pyridoxamine 5'-phosphate oxidase superfamily)|nr:pyridoxamine 5'-phosphate oxidase family protein [Deltaproteobacteria bacterium]